MRVNEPITNREVLVEDGAVLVSRTDPQGRIAFVNTAFTTISGRSCCPWEGLVKNRSKTGDFY